MSVKKPFGYEPLLTQEDIRTAAKKKKQRANNWQQTLLRVWQIVDEQRLLLILVLIMVVISSLLALLGPYLVGYIIDHFIVKGTTEGMLRIVVALISIYIVQAIASYMQNYWMVGVAQQTIWRMRTNLFAHLQKLPLRFFDHRQHGEIMSRATNDIEAVSNTLNSAFIQVFSSVITLVGTVIIMLSLSPLLTAITMCIIPLMFFGMRWITRRTGKLFKEQQKAMGALNGMIEESISGQSIVKAFSQEQRMIAQFEKESAKLRRAGFWAQSYSGYIPKVMNVLNNLSFTIVAGVGGILALYGYVSVGVIVIFTEYTRQFTRPLNDLANQFNTVLSAIAGAERVFAVMDEPIEEDAKGAQPASLQGEVAFHNVYFNYDEHATDYTLKNISFTAKRNESVALVGATGAGKTTIMQLVARLYQPTKGTITFDGINADAITLQSIRQNMAFVLQEPFLFEASVADNIRYGKLQATDEEIIAAAKKAHADEFILALPNGYNTILSADGSEISQGQKQLLSIARAFVANPMILLLDEATSSIDTITEMYIQDALNTLMQGRTSIIIAHRLNTVRHADKIIVLAQGEILEAGNQQALIEADGVYAAMLRNAKSL